jgi:hypothetical protein
MKKMKNRKTMLALAYALAIAVVIWTLPLNPVAASEAVPIKGSVAGNSTFTVDFPLIHVTSVGVGHMSHLGRTTYQGELDILIGPQTATGTITFTAANGDNLTATVSGIIPPPDPQGLGEFDLTDTITGGTGRFSDATGSILIHGVSQATGPNSSVNFSTLRGTISSVGSNEN